MQGGGGMGHFINGMEKFNFNSLQTQENRPGII